MRVKFTVRSPCQAGTQRWLPSSLTACNVAAVGLFASRLGTSRMKPLLENVTAQLADTSHTLTVPTDRPRPDEPSYAGRQLRCELAPALASALRRFCAAEGFTLYAAMHAVYQIVLHRVGGADAFLIGSAVANRRSRKSEGMLGMFVNMIPIRADVSGNPSYRELLERTVATLSASYEHEELPFELLVRAVATMNGVMPCTFSIVGKL